MFPEIEVEVIDSSFNSSIIVAIDGDYSRRLSIPKRLVPNPRMGQWLACKNVQVNGLEVVAMDSAELIPELQPD